MTSTRWPRPSPTGRAQSSCNPNNPTGTVVDADDLRTFLRKVPSDVVVALDEACFEYMRLGPHSAYDALELRREFANLVVLRAPSRRRTDWPACVWVTRSPTRRW